MQEDSTAELLENDKIDSIKIKFFNLNKDLLGKDFVEDIESKNPYSNFEEVQGIFSHLSYLDAMQRRKNIALGEVEHKPLSFSLELGDKNNQQITKYTFDNINLGEGNFTKGIEHLLSVGMIQERGTMLQKLDKNLSMPNALKVADLNELGYNTKHSLKAIAQSQVLGEDVSVFMDSFLKNLLDKDDREKTKPQSKENAQTKQELMSKVKEFTSQKKSKNKEYEISNNKGIGMGR